MTPEQQVFIDAVMDLGFEHVSGTDQWDRFERRGEGGGIRIGEWVSSTIGVGVYPETVVITWRTSSGISGADPFLFPAMWDQALERIRELIRKWQS